MKAYQKYFILSNEDVLLDKVNNYKEFIQWPKSKQYNGYIRNLNGFTLSEGIKVYEIGILIVPEDEIMPIKDSFTRHCYIVYTVKRQAKDENCEKIVEDFFFEEFVNEKINE